MDYINTEELGKDMIVVLAKSITPDETLDKINEFVHTAVDLDMSGLEKAEWVKNEVLDLGMKVWDLLLPILIKAFYEAMMSMVEEVANA